MTPTESARVDLGHMLYFEKRLSKHRDLSCNSCHRLSNYGVDHESTSIGAKGKRGRRNSPSVYFAASHFTSFWDGRAKNIEEQAKGPILDPNEMGMDRAQAVTTILSSIPGYVTAFAAAFPDQRSPITYDNLSTAIGAFERRLVTPSRWDRYLDGDRSALTAQEQAGLKVFTDVGCVTCHTGQLVGGSMFQKAGFVRPWGNQADQGRFELTGLEADKMVFKVPSLRNVAMTAPYFHDGSAKTLVDAVRSMAEHQLEDTLVDAEIASIVVWLGSMTGEIPKAYSVDPTLPADGPTTPRAP
jgi:cytochrome c peroxidase